MKHRDTCRNPLPGLVGITLLSVALSGCSGWLNGKDGEEGGEQPTAYEDTFARIAAARERLQELEEPTSAERPELEVIRTPREGTWLARELTARYRNLPADEALRSVTGERPIRFDLSIPDTEEGTGFRIPLVSWLPSAVTVHDHIRSICAQADWHCDHQDGVTRVSDLVTRHFDLSTQPGSFSAGLGLRNLRDTGGTTADSEVELTLNPYEEEVLEGVRNVLRGDDSAIVSLSGSSNLLTVTARPGRLDDVAEFLDRHNASSSRIVRVQLSLFEVDFTDEERRNLAVDLIRSSSEIPLALLIGQPALGIGPDGNFDGYVEGGTIGAVVAEEGGRAAGSSAVFQWLDQLGDASIAFDQTFETLNNRITSLDLTRTEQFVSSISREAVEGSNEVKLEVEFDELRTGMVLHVQPTVTPNLANRVTLRLGLSRSALIGRNTYDFGSVQGETHVTDDMNRILSISLRDGEPRLITSLSEHETRGSRAGIPVAGLFSVPTNRNRTWRERELVMLVTATVVPN